MSRQTSKSPHYNLLLSGFRFPPFTFTFTFTFFQFASFVPTHVTLRAAFGRLPSQRPLSCVQVSNFTPYLFQVSSLKSQVSNPTPHFPFHFSRFDTMHTLCIF
jgi:hypothetical protein